MKYYALNPLNFIFYIYYILFLSQFCWMINTCYVTNQNNNAGYIMHYINITYQQRT